MHRSETFIRKLNESDATNQTDSVSNIVLQTIPIGFHKVLKLDSLDILLGILSQQECKFLKFIHTAKKETLGDLEQGK